MDVRESPRFPKSPSTAPSSSTSGVEREVQQEEDNNTNDHSSKQIRSLISASFTTPKLKPNASSILAKRPVVKLKPAPVSTDTTVEKSQVVDKKKKKNARAVNEKNPHRVWSDKDEILLLLAATDCVKRGENPNSLAFCESIQNSFSVDVSLEQIRSKVKHARERYEATEEQEKKGKVLKFKTLHLQECYQLSKPIWGSAGEPKDGGGGGEGSGAVGVEKEDDLEIRKSERVKKRKVADSIKPKDGDGATEEPEEQIFQVHAVAEKQKDGGGGGEGSERVEDGKRKTDSSEREDGAAMRMGNKKQKDVNAATVMEEPEENNVQVAENQKEGEEGENQDRNKKKKNRRAGASVPVSEKLKAPADNQGHDEKERKKKKRKVGNADSVSENLIERWTKALSGSGSYLSEENKKAIQSIEPSSKLAALLEKLEKLQLQKMEMLLKEALLVREFVLMVSEAERSPTF